MSEFQSELNKVKHEARIKRHQKRMVAQKVGFRCRQCREWLLPGAVTCGKCGRAQKRADEAWKYGKLGAASPVRHIDPKTYKIK